MRIYIGGPMTDIEAFNYPAFEAAEQRLLALGHEPVNPAKLHGDAPAGSLSHAEYMRADLRALLDCDAIYLLPGWSASVGARCEEHVARTIGMPLFHQALFAHMSLATMSSAMRAWIPEPPGRPAG